MAIWPIKGGMSELIAQLPDAVRESVALVNEGEIQRRLRCRSESRQ